VHRAVIERDLAALAAPAFEPDDGVLHPVRVVAVGKSSCAWAPRLSLRLSAPMHRADRLRSSGCRAPASRSGRCSRSAAIGDGDVGIRLVDRDLVHLLRPRRSSALSRNTAACFCMVCCISRRTLAVGEPARPNTTRSISELEPRRLAPCTDTQAASPTAIRPGTTHPDRRPQRHHLAVIVGGMPPML
jgi:hypothetical protein